MNIKKSLIALSIVHAGIISAQDKPSISNAVKTLVVAPVAAMGLMGVEAIYRSCKAYNNLNYNPSKAIYPVGPAFITDQAERMARNNQDNRYFLTSEDKKILETMAYRGATDRSAANAWCNLELVHGEKEIFMNDQLPKVFKKHAFYRNLALIWGGMHIYDTYKSIKKEKYS